MPVLLGCGPADPSAESASPGTVSALVTTVAAREREMKATLCSQRRAGEGLSTAAEAPGVGACLVRVCESRARPCVIARSCGSPCGLQ